MVQNGFPIILISIDALRGDRSHYLKAQSEELRDDFAEFSAVSHGVATPLAFPGLFSGTLPQDNGELPRDRQTLSEIIEAFSVGFSNNGHLSSHRGYDRGFDVFGDLAPPGNESPLDQLRAIDWLRNNRVVQAVYQRLITIYRDSNHYRGDSAVPIPYRTAPSVVDFFQRHLQKKSVGFVWGHFMDPHAPYHPDTAIGDVPEISRTDLQSLTNRIYSFDAGQLSRDELDLVRTLYDGNVRYTASHLANLLDWCADQRWYKDSFIAITSDHGELLGEYGELTHPWDTTPYDELINVPLFVKFPEFEQRGISFSHQVQHMDLYEMISSLMKSGGEVWNDSWDALLDEQPREIISVSNTTLRATTSDGVAFRDLSGDVWTEGEVTDSTIERLEDLALPKCENNSGDVPGWEADRREAHLKALGYK